MPHARRRVRPASEVRQSLDRRIQTRRAEACSVAGVRSHLSARGGSRSGWIDRRQFPGPLEVLNQLFGYPVGDIGAGAMELAALALLCSGPDHVAILIHQPDRGYGFMFAFFDVAAFVFSDAEATVHAVAIAHTVIASCTAAVPQISPGVDFFA